MDTGGAGANNSITRVIAVDESSATMERIAASYSQADLAYINLLATQKLGIDITNQSSIALKAEAESLVARNKALQVAAEAYAASEAGQAAGVSRAARIKAEAEAARELGLSYIYADEAYGTFLGLEEQAILTSEERWALQERALAARAADDAAWEHEIYLMKGMAAVEREETEAQAVQTAAKQAAADVAAERQATLAAEAAAMEASMVASREAAAAEWEVTRLKKEGVFSDQAVAEAEAQMAMNRKILALATTDAAAAEKLFNEFEKAGLVTSAAAGASPIISGGGITSPAAYSGMSKAELEASEVGQHNAAIAAANLAQAEQNVAASATQVAANQKIANAAMQEGETAANALGQAHLRVHAGALSTGMGLNILGVAALGTAAALAYSTIQAIAWEKELNLLHNNTRATTDEINQMGVSILDLSTKTGLSAQDLAAASRRVLDYGFSLSQTQEIMRTTSEASIATGAKAETTAQAVAQALFQYKQSADEASRYTEILLLMSQRANTTMEDFAEGTKRATGIAAEIHVPYEQATAALSALTLQYGNINQAQTQLLDMMRYILKPTQEEAEAWDDVAKKSGHAELSAKNLSTTLGTGGLTPILSGLKDAYQKMGLSEAEAEQQTLKLINAQRGGFGLLTLLTGANQKYYENLTFTNSATADAENVNDAFNRTLDTASNKWERVGAGIHKVAIGLGDFLAGPAGLLGDFLMAGEHQTTRFEESMSRMARKVGQDSALLKEAFSSDTKSIAAQMQALYGQAIPFATNQAILANQQMLTSQQRYTEAQKTLDLALLKSKDQTTAGIKDYLMRQMQALQAELDRNTADTSNWTEDQKAAYQDWHDKVITQIREVADAYQLLTAADATSKQSKSEQLVIEEAVAAQRKKVAEETHAAAMEEAKLTQQTNLLKSAFAGIGEIKDMGGTQSMVRDVTNSLTKLETIMQEKGTAAAAAYAQSLQDRWQSLGPEARSSLEPIMIILEQFIKTAQVDGDAAGDGWADHFHAGLKSWQDDINDIFDQYATAADMQDLFQKLGIATGDNFGANVDRKIAEWFGPYKENLMKYLEAARTVADGVAATMRSISNAQIEASQALDKAGLSDAAQRMEQIGRIGEMRANLADQSDAAYNAAVAKLNSLEATVKAQGEAAKAEHAAKAGAKGGGAGPEQAALTEEKRRQAVEEQTAKLAAIIEEGHLRDERDKLNAVTKNLADTQKYWKDALKEEQDIIKAGARAHQEGMAPLEHDIRRVTNALRDMRAEHEVVIHDMNEKLYTYDLQLKQIEKDAKNALAVPKQMAKEAAEALDLLSRQTATTDHMYTLLKELVQDEQRAFEEQAKTIMGPLDDAYKEAQANLDAVTDKYRNKLLPIEAELLALQQEQAKLDRGKQLADEAQQVGNLQARLANVIPGTREYYALLKARDEASGKLGRDIRVDTLTTEKEKIEKARDAEVKRAQDAVKAAKEQVDAETELLKQQREALRVRLDAITREQELYDRQQREKIIQATEAKRVADETVTKEQADWELKKTLVQNSIDKLKEEEQAYAHNASEQERTTGLVLTSMQNLKTQRDTDYTDWVTSENNKLADMQTNADSAIAIAQKAMDDMKAIFTEEKDKKEDQDYLNKLKGAMNDLSNAVTTADLPIKIKGVGTETANLNIAARDAATNTLALAGALLTNLTPATAGLGTTTGTALQTTSDAWGALFDVKGSDPKNITNKLFKHSDEGFFTSMDNKTVIAMDFSKGVWNGKLLELSAVVIDGNLVPMATSAGLAAEGVGKSIDDGIAKGITDNKETIRTALSGAISDGMTNAKLDNGISSPSKRFADELGFPIAAGIAQGIIRGSSLVDSSIRNVLGGAYNTMPVGGVGTGGSGGGNIAISLSGLTLTMPNVQKLPTDPNAYREAASAIMYAVAYEARRRGLKEIQVIGGNKP